MKVIIKLPGELKHKGIDYNQVVETQEEITLVRFLELLNLKQEEIRNLVVIVNGKLARKKLVLKDGDEIIFLTPLTGG